MNFVTTEVVYTDDRLKSRINEYATKGSAGFDLLAACYTGENRPEWWGVEYELSPGFTVKINTCTKMAIPEGYAGLIVPRSGLGSKGIVLANTVGVIDSDYRGEVIVALRNTGTEPFRITPMMKIAQMLIMPVSRAILKVVDELDTTERGEGGFGSTGN